MKSRSFASLLAPLLLALVSGLAACNNPVGEGGHRTAREALITEADGETVIAQTQNNEQWLGGPLVLQAGESREVRVFFVDPAGNRFQLPTTGASHTLYLEFDDPAVASYEALPGERGRLHGLAAGTTTLIVNIWHGVHPGGHPDWPTPALDVLVEP